MCLNLITALDMIFMVPLVDVANFNSIEVLFFKFCERWGLNQDLSNILCMAINAERRLVHHQSGPYTNHTAIVENKTSRYSKIIQSQ